MITYQEYPSLKVHLETVLYVTYIYAELSILFLLFRRGRQTSRSSCSTRLGGALRK